jgi:acyl carrier protein
MSEEILCAKIRSFIHDRFPTVVAKQLADEESLLESGAVDSLGILELVTYLDSELGIELADDDLSPENFGSIASILRFAAAKKAA